MKLIALHGVRSKSLNKADIVTPIEAKINRNGVEMAELEANQSVATKVALQAAMTVVLVIREADSRLIKGGKP